MLEDTIHPLHIVNGVCPEGPSHEEVGPCLRALLGHRWAQPWHVLHTLALLDLQGQVAPVHVCCSVSARGLDTMNTTNTALELDTLNTRNTAPLCGVQLFLAMMYSDLAAGLNTGILH